MPPPAAVAPVGIRGEVLRVYLVETVEDVDYYLRCLQHWLTEELQARPGGGMRAVRRYLADRDKLLDARGRLMGLVHAT